MQTPPCDGCCNQMRALLADNDAQRGDLAQAIAAHLATCETCRASDAEIARLLASYRASAAAPLSAALESRLLDSLCLKLHR